MIPTEPPHGYDDLGAYWDCDYCTERHRSGSAWSRCACLDYDRD